jgi:ribokinase
LSGGVARVICAGHVNWDVTLHVDQLPAVDGEASIRDQFQSVGGGAANVARALAALDVGPVLLGSVGDDDHGHLARRSLSDADVDCEALVTADDETTVKYLVVDPAGDVVVFGNDGANEAFAPTALPDDALAAAEYLHLTSQEPATATALARRARDSDVTVCFDPGRRISDRDFESAMALADVLFFNSREAAAAISDHFGPIEDVDRTVVIKQGADGAEVLTEGGQYSVHDGFVVDAVDTTGAGDAFAAGFIAACLERTGPPDYERCLTVANACGAMAARDPGPRASLSWDRIEAAAAGDAGQ